MRPAPIRYYLAFDGDGHEYVVPVDRHDEWETWAALPVDEHIALIPPSFARRITMPLLTFTDPRDS